MGKASIGSAKLVNRAVVCLILKCGSGGVCRLAQSLGYRRLFVREFVVQALDHLKNLVIMAAADGALHQEEIVMLAERCSAWGLAEEDLESAIEFALSGNAKLQFPIDRFEQNQMLSDLIRMMAADGKLTEIEKRLFALAAAKMGIEKVELEALIDQLVGKIT